MQKSFVIVAVDLIKQLNHNQEFVYRAWVNSELFTERTWIWDDRYYLEENLQIEAPPGEYRILFTVHNASSEVLQIKNMRIVHGPGRIVKERLVLD